MREVDRVLHDVHLVLEGREDVHRGVGDDDDTIDRGHIHDEAMTDAPTGAQPGVALDDRGHDLVGVQAALHQHLRLAFPGEANGGLGRRDAVRRIDQFEGGDVDPELFGDRRDARARPDQDRADQAQLRGFRGAAQGTLVAGMRHRAGRRRQRLAVGDQGVVLVVLSFGHGCLPLCCCGLEPGDDGIDVRSQTLTSPCARSSCAVVTAAA